MFTATTTMLTVSHLPPPLPHPSQCSRQQLQQQQVSRTPRPAPAMMHLVPQTRPSSPRHRSKLQQRQRPLERSTRSRSPRTLLSAAVVAVGALLCCPNSSQRSCRSSPAAPSAAKMPRPPQCLSTRHCCMAAAEAASSRSPWPQQVPRPLRSNNNSSPSSAPCPHNRHYPHTMARSPTTLS